MRHLYTILNIMRDRLLTAQIAGLGEGNIIITNQDTPACNYGLMYCELSYGGPTRSGGYGGGNIYKFWRLNVDLFKVLPLHEVNMSRRAVQDLVIASQRVQQALYLWYPGFWPYTTAKTYVAGDMIIFGSNYYRCLIASTNQDPTSYPTHWKYLGVVDWFSFTTWAAQTDAWNLVTYGGNYWLSTKQMSAGEAAVAPGTSAFWEKQTRVPGPLVQNIGFLNETPVRSIVAGNRLEFGIRCSFELSNADEMSSTFNVPVN